MVHLITEPATKEHIFQMYIFSPYNREREISQCNILVLLISTLNFFYIKNRLCTFFFFKCRTPHNYDINNYQRNIFNEPAHWADSVSKLRCPSVVCQLLCVPLFTCFVNILLLSFTKVKSPINRLQKDSLGES